MQARLHLENQMHSGAEIEASEHARKYPLLHAPVLACASTRKVRFGNSD